MEKLLVTNFAYGTGPYLRTTELAIAFNAEREKHGLPRLRMVIPWVYGEKQRRIMLEEFSEHDKQYPGEMLLDATLGAILGSIFYGKGTYEQALARWVGAAADASKKAHDHLQGSFEVETLSGKKETVNGKDIIVELNRSPRLRFDVAPSYSATFALTGEILDRARKEPAGTFAVSPELFEQGMRIADDIESSQKMTLITYPATFTFENGYTPRQRAEVIPPTMEPLTQKENARKVAPGIYMTITGIPGLERLYSQARALGMTIYSNDQEAVPGSVHALPHIITNNNIKLHFARSGWGSVWLSMLTQSPLVIPDFDATDDPEIYFNNKAVEAMGIGIVYRGQPLAELLAAADGVRKKQGQMVSQIERRFGTLEGTRMAARRFVDDFLKQ